MNSPFAQLLMALQTYVAAQVTEIKHIDQDFGQLEQPDPPVSFPCLLVDFPDTQWTQLQHYQDGKIIVRLKLGYDTYSNSSQNTPNATIQTALNFYEIEHKLYTKLQTWNASGLLTLPLIRLSSTTEKQEERKLRVRVNDYECTFSDNSVTT